MNRLAIIFLAAALQGCAGFQAYELEALGRAQAATDALTARSEWWLCEGRPVGQFQRECTDKKKCIATNDLCAARQPTWTRIGETKP